MPLVSRYLADQARRTGNPQTVVRSEREIVISQDWRFLAVWGLVVAAGLWFSRDRSERWRVMRRKMTGGEIDAVSGPVKVALRGA